MEKNKIDNFINKALYNKEPKPEHEDSIESSVTKEDLAKNLDISLEELELKLRDQKWRLNNLYYIKDENGMKVKFKMRPVQEELFDNLWFRNVIPKSRQHGITTFMSLLALDNCIFRKNYSASIIAQDLNAMKKIFKNTIKFAWDQFPKVLKHTFSDLTSDNALEMSLGNGSSISVTLSTRSGTPQFLHISELGPIVAKSPEKADEIRSGALNSSHVGNMVTIESTAKGSVGLFADLCFKAKELQDSGEVLSPLDFKLFFFPWWKDPKNSIADEYLVGKTINQHTKDYFRSIREQVDHYNFTEGQMMWWQIKEGEQRGSMNEEQPSTFDESFNTIVENAYYKQELQRLLEEGRLRDISINPDYYVYTAWDLGMNDLNPIIFFQYYNGNLYLIDGYKNSGAGLEHYVNVLEKKGYRYGGHYLPHDVEVKEVGSGTTRKQTLYNLGLRNIITQVHHKADQGTNFKDGIDQVRRTFSKIYIDKSRCSGKDSVFESLMNYQQEVSSKTGLPTGTHRKNGAQHYADALRVLCTTFKFHTVRLNVNGDRDENTNMVQTTNSFG